MRKPTIMNRPISKQWVFALTILLITSCRPQTNQSSQTTPPRDWSRRDTASSESGYADVNGLKMYYEVHGSGKPVVLLHGSFMTIPLNWSQIIPLLAQHRKVVVAEMQGHGRTKDIDRKLSYEAMADDVSVLLEQLKIDSADILGYSMGGGIAFQFAIRHPEQLRRLVILSSAYAHDGWWPGTEASFATFEPEMFNGTPIRKQYDSLGNDPKHFAELVRKVIGIDLRSYDWTKEATAITAPVLYAIGDADGIRYEHAIAFFRAKGGGKQGDLFGLPKSRLAILPGTTHIGMIKRPDILIPIVEDFLDADLNAVPPGF